MYAHWFLFHFFAKENVPPTTSPKQQVEPAPPSSHALVDTMMCRLLQQFNAVGNSILAGNGLKIEYLQTGASQEAANSGASSAGSLPLPIEAPTSVTVQQPAVSAAPPSQSEVKAGSHNDAAEAVNDQKTLEDYENENMQKLLDRDDKKTAKGRGKGASKNTAAKGRGGGKGRGVRKLCEGKPKGMKRPAASVSCSHRSSKSLQSVGCSKCRGSGCTQCKNPAFQGQMFSKDEWATRAKVMKLK